ncbi:vWA domain-containing protein [Hyperthermus butylicus]|uniref:von Willebrand factor type A protein (VWA) n=1 Tax=Hyperthermus butylicus (strain DSM 5456 / JCM 9403 / PLM1-5) TaxID=415426 RepID=A2BJF9_HYPBU|nr:vWA domain-containing protein [Hyperthermus butylicus]ABM80120.1 Von Willebrand factor type A protein (vWA) [Hyperthermus butylicus DSM 5456]
MAIPSTMLRVLKRRPLSYTVLVIFMLDRSLSMSELKTYDHRSKWEHLVELVERLLARLARSNMAPAFRVGFVWFSDDVKVVERGGAVYFPVTEHNPALRVFQESTEENRPYGMTAMADALEHAAMIIERYIEDTSIPSEKYVTVFMFTDGKETKRTPEDVVEVADRITGELQEKLRALNQRNRIGLATIALGLDADRETLRTIASFLREAQRRVLEERGLIDLVDPPYHEKMFIDAPRNDKITREWEEAVRRFVERLSETAIF